MAGRTVVLILGAGSTVADVATRSAKKRPPLDKGFFSIARSYAEVGRIAAYFRDIYKEDIRTPANDSLEGIMARLYTDIYDPGIGTKAAAAFRDLIRLFNKRLAVTTNSIKPSQKRFLYRMLIQYLKDGVDPSNITIVTFNQDLQIEKILDKLERSPRWKKHRPIFRFPACYMLNVPPNRITAPTNGAGHDLFDVGDPKPAGIRVLKLHGSLNWYSAHRSQNPSPKAMFDPRRELRITQRRVIDLDMSLVGRHTRIHTLPVVVPPVTHKSGILHGRTKHLWGLAEDAMRNSDEIVIFGYSCPQLDFESSNLIRRSIKQNTKYSSLSVVDPDPNALRRYVEVIGPSRVSYYRFASDFLR